MTAGLSVLSGLTNQSIPDLLVQGALTPFRAVATSLTNTVERYYSYMFKYEALEAENAVLKAQIAEMEDTTRQAAATSRENERLRAQNKLLATHESYVMTDAYIIGWSSTDFTSVLTINRGTNSGIDVNMCAVTANGEVVVRDEIRTGHRSRPRHHRPPDRNAPSLTSLMRWAATLSRTRASISSAAAS